VARGSHFHSNYICKSTQDNQVAEQRNKDREFKKMGLQKWQLSPQPLYFFSVVITVVIISGTRNKKQSANSGLVKNIKNTFREI